MENETLQKRQDFEGLSQPYLDMKNSSARRVGISDGPQQFARVQVPHGNLKTVHTQCTSIKQSTISPLLKTVNQQSIPMFIREYS